MDKPIAWYDPTNGAVSTDKDSPLFTPLGQLLPLYTKQEDDGITLTTIRHPRGKPALGDLNPESLEQVEIDLPEPFEYWNAVEGWVKIDEVREHFDSVGCGTIYKTSGEGREPLYTTPPQRTWVGLTDEELDALYRAVKIRLMGTYDTKDIYRAVEAKLKEKNT
jgi:hypothetical protein